MARALPRRPGDEPPLRLDQLAVSCFDAALADVGITSEPLRGVLHDYFAWSTDRMGLHPDSPDSVADDERLPHWGWNGLVTR